MVGLAKKLISHTGWFVLILAGTLCACQARADVPTAPPPLPQIHTTSQGNTASSLLTEEPASPVVEPTSTPIPETIEEMARLEYGDRLIDWLEIPAIDVLAPVTPVGWSPADDPDSPESRQWDSPDAKVGWVLSSALPGGQGGNVILYGHNNIHSSVFRDLAELRNGDRILLRTGEGEWVYLVAEVNIFPVLEQEEDAAAYAEYFKPGRAPRLTVVSCWPPTNNTHRVIVVAYPLL